MCPQLGASNKTNSLTGHQNLDIQISIVFDANLSISSKLAFMLLFNHTEHLKKLLSDFPSQPFKTTHTSTHLGVHSHLAKSLSLLYSQGSFLIEKGIMTHLAQLFTLLISLSSK